MNHIYRLVWSHVTQGWVPASEITRGRGKSSRRKLVAAALALTATVAEAGPTGGQVVSGNGTIAQSGSTTTVTQSSQNLSLNWTSFNIAPQEAVNFLQPSVSSVAVNRISDPNASQILGQLHANGQIYLINPNGILFGAGAQVDVGGLVASTLDSTTAAPAGDQRSFAGSGTGSVVNEGTITAANGGYVALLGNHVSNQGTITAQLGTVALGAGSAVTLTFSKDTLVQVQVDRSVLNSVAENGGLIQADGGRVIMTAGANDALLASAVNNTGVIEARTVENHEGTITLLGGMAAGTVTVDGTLDASAPNGGNGGSIETSAATVKVGNDAKVTTAAASGLTGSWSLDPFDFTIAPSGGDISGATLTGLLGSNSVTISTSPGTNSATQLYPSTTNGSGNIYVNDTVSWSSHTLTLNAAQDIDINAAMTVTGTGGLTMTSTGGHVNVGFLTIGLFAGAVNFSGSGALQINGNPYTVISNAAELEAINSGLSGHYALGTNITLSADETATAQGTNGSATRPIGFTGTFDGLGHTISGLNLSANTQGIGVGLFGGNYGVIQNVGVSGTLTLGGGGNPGVAGGLLAGWNSGTIRNSYTTGTVNGVDSALEVGGLVGANTGTIFNSHSSATIGGDGTATQVGGLVGANYGGTISNSYATGNVSGGSYVGGLVGQNSFNELSYINSTGGAVSSISNSFATGAVSGNSYVGGLVGLDLGGSGVAATISNSYATGSVTGSTYTGGLVGGLGTLGGVTASISNSFSSGLVSAGGGGGGLLGCNGVGCGLLGPDSGTVTGSFWNTTTSTRSTSAAGTGLTTAEMQTPAGAQFTSATAQNGNVNPGWSTSTWAFYSGSYPLLIADMTPLTITANSVVKTYNGNAFSGDVAGVTYSVPGASSSLSGTLSYGGTSQTVVDVGGGTYSIIPSGLSVTTPTQLGYYITYVNGTLTLNKLALSGSISTGSSTYGSVLAPGTASFTNVVGSDNLGTATVAVNTVGLTSSSGKLTAGTHTGIEAISGLSGPAAGNYSFAGVTGSYTVSPLTLTATIATGNSTYGSALAPGAVSFSNLVSGDTVTAGSVSVATNGLTSTSGNLIAGNHAGIESVGSTLSGADAGNYTFAGATGNYQVGQLTLTGTIAAGTSTYGSALTPGAVSLNNVIAGDTITAGTVTVNTTGLTSSSGNLIAGNHAGIESVGSTLSGADANNYTFAGATGNYDVGKLALNGAIATGTSTYGSALTPGAVSFNNVIAGDTVTAGTVTVNTTGLTSSSGNLIAGNHAGTESVGTTLSGADANNYTFVGATGNYDVGQLALTGAIATGTSTYGSALTPGAVSFSNLVSGDTVTAGAVTVATNGLTSGSGNLIAGNHAGIESVSSTLSGADANNYTFAGATGNYDVSKLALTGAIAAGSSTYGSALAPGAFSFNNLVSGDTVTAGSVSVATNGLTSGSGNLIAGNHTAIESVGTTLSGADANNYTFAGATGNYDVGQLALNGAIATGTSTYGSALTPGAVTFNNLIAGDTVTAGTVTVTTTGLTSGSGNLIAGNHGGIESVGTTLSGADAGNYTFAGATGNYDVGQLALTGAVAAGTSTYGSALTPGTFSFNNLIAGDAVTTSAVTVTTIGLTSSSGNLVAGNHAGIESVGSTLSGTDANNYTFAGATGNYDVGKLALTGALATGNSVYGSALTPGTFSFNNLVAGDAVTASAVTVATNGLTSGSGNLVAGNHTGIETVGNTLSGADANNYTFVGATGNYDVGQLALTGAIATGTSTYGSALAPGAVSFNNLIAGDTVTAGSVSVATNGLTSGSGNLVAGNHAGIESVGTTLSGADANNYTFAGATGNYDVSKLALTGAIATGTSTYGSALAPGTFSFNNLIAGDTLTAGTVTVTTTGLTSGSGNLIAGNHAGIESVGNTLNGADANNYTFAGATGNYDVSQLALTGALATGNSTYGSTLTAGAVSFNNLIAGDVVTAGAGTVTTTGLTSSSGNLVAGNHAGIESVGSTLSGADAGNYTFAGATGNYDVSKLALTGALATGNSVYGSALTPGTFGFNNLVAGDAVTASSVTVTTAGLTSASGNLIAGNHAGIESVGSTLSGADANNYTFAGATGNYDVAKLALTGAIATGNSTYGSALTPGAVSFNNLIAGDTVTAGAATVNTTGLTSSSGNLIAGNHTGIEAVGTTLSGADANNYTFAGATGNYDVGTLALLVTGSSAANKVYDGTNTATLVGGTLSSVISGDSVSLSQSGSLASKNVGNGIAVTATDSLGGSSASNYTLVEPTGLNANITPATLAYAANPASGFAGQVPPLSGAVSGFVSGDTQSNATAGSLSWTTTGNTNQAGQYAIDGSGLTAGNYVFVQAPGNASALTLAPATAPQQVVDVRSDLQSGTLSSHEAVTVDTTTAFAGSVPVHVLNGGVKLPADTVGLH
jgi:filamentous hemagglutinin family protein